MATPPIFLSSVLLVLLVAAVVCGLLYLKWWQKRRRHADFELLLDDIISKQSSRSNKLYTCLIDGYQYDRIQAKQLSEELIGAEKLFLQQFVEQQIQQTSVAEFYQQLCKLLDSYLVIQKTEARKAHVGSSSAEVEQGLGESIAGSLAEQSAETVAPPSWGDVFD